MNIPKINPAEAQEKIFLLTRLNKRTPTTEALKAQTLEKIKAQKPETLEQAQVLADFYAYLCKQK